MAAAMSRSTRQSTLPRPSRVAAGATGRNGIAVRVPQPLQKMVTPIRPASSRAKPG